MTNPQKEDDLVRRKAAYERGELFLKGKGYAWQCILVGELIGELAELKLDLEELLPTLRDRS